MINAKQMMVIFVNFFYILFLGILLSNVSNAQNQLYTVDINGTIFRADYENCVLHKVCDMDIWSWESDQYYWADISFDTSGNLYFLEARGQVYHIDTITGQLSPYFRFENTPYQYLSGLTCDYKGVFYAIGGNGDIMTFDPETNIHVRKGKFSNDFIGLDITFYNGKLYFFTVTNPRILLEANFADPPVSREVMSLGTFSPKGLSTYADSCQSHYITGTAGRAYGPDKINFGIIYPELDSIRFNCNRIFPNPLLGGWGSAYRYEHLASMPSVEIMSDSVKLEIMDYCTPEARLLIRASGGIDTLRYAIDSLDFGRDSVFILSDTGWHYFYVKDSRSCMKMDSVYFQLPSPMILDSLEITPSYCPDHESGSILVHTIGGLGTHLYSIDGLEFQSDSIFNNLEAGALRLYFKDSTGCIQDTLIQIPTLPPPIIDLIVTPEYCAGATGSIRVQLPDGRNPLRYSLNGVDFQIQNVLDQLGSGTYEIFVSDSIGCIYRQTTMLPRILDTIWSSIQDTSCAYDAIRLDTLAFISYLGCDSFVVRTGIPGDISVLNTQEYDCNITAPYQDSVYIQHQDACDTLWIRTFNPAPSHDTIMYVDTCSVESAISPFVFRLINSYGCDSMIEMRYRILPMYSQDIHLTTCSPRQVDTTFLVSNTGCDSLLINHYMYQPPLLKDVYHFHISNGDTIQLVHGLDVNLADSYSWTPTLNMLDSMSLEPQVSPPNNMEYQLKVITKAGCEWISRFFVHVTDDFPVFIPTGFSPNGDGINDKFRVYFAEEKGIRLEQMNLYDRWGNQVYTCNSSDCSWDGTYQDQDLNPGVFIYQIHLRTIDGILIIKKGEVSLMR